MQQWRMDHARTRHAVVHERQQPPFVVRPMQHRCRFETVLGIIPSIGRCVPGGSSRPDQVLDRGFLPETCQLVANILGIGGRCAVLQVEGLDALHQPFSSFELLLILLESSGGSWSLHPRRLTLPCSRLANGFYHQLVLQDLG